MPYPQVFVPKVSWWLFGPISLLVLGSGLAPLFYPTAIRELLPLLLSLLALAFMLHFLLSTRYILTAEHVLVKSSFFRWRIPVQRITHVSATHNPLSSPAPSLDRLRIRYNSHDSLLISPRDKAGFVAALRQLNPAIQTA